MPLNHSIAFDPASPLASLANLPEAPGVFALYAVAPIAGQAGPPAAEPYLSKTANLRRRLTRLLRGGQAAGESGAQPITRRLQLAHMVRHIEYAITGSEFESSLCLYDASLAAFGERARRRLRLRPPAFLRMSLDNPYPRVYSTSRITRSAARALFGPFPSRAAAERYAEEMLNLFLLRRCTDDLHPDPSFPGCPYSEMKMCLAPCYQGCSDERYQHESAEVLAFLSTRGGSLLKKLETERDAASEALQFERAAALHQRMQKVDAAAHLAGEAVHPLAQLHGIVVQPAVEGAALFRLHGGVLNGPALYSTTGVRLANERSGSTSLFAHPFVVEALPLEAQSNPPLSGRPQKDILEPRLLEQRLDEALRKLAQSAPKAVSAKALSDHLALFARWFYRPAARRVGEIVFAEDDGQVPRKPLLRAISRVASRGTGEVFPPPAG